ncbi:MAG: amidohydrolase family protein, partial [Candidatus Methanomethyliaceae archaeon]
KGGIRIVTLAPELPGAHELISWLTELGVIVSIGHTNASYEEAKAAIAAGARRATHLFNAMTPIHHRKPGAVIACLEAPNVYLEIIADLVHVAGPLVRLVWQLVGTGRIVAITDAIAAAGLPDGTYTLADQPMRVEGGVARLEDGRLAGSTLPLAKNVQNLVALGVPIPDALAMASSVPARSIGLPDMGTIFPGALADLVVLDHDLRVKRTYIAGKLVFAADP